MAAVWRLHGGTKGQPSPGREQLGVVVPVDLPVRKTDSERLIFSRLWRLYGGCMVVLKVSSHLPAEGVGRHGVEVPGRGSLQVELTWVGPDFVS